MSQFPDEAASRQYMFQLRWPDGFCCTRCGHDAASYITTRDLYECVYCKTQISITSNTLLHRTKLPMSYWLFVFYWFTTEQDCSARKLSALLSIHYRTALRMVHIVREAMRDWNGAATGMPPALVCDEPLPQMMVVQDAVNRLGVRARRVMASQYRRIRYWQRYVDEFIFRKQAGVWRFEVVEPMLYHAVAFSSAKLCFWRCNAR
nr:IS1595 family transposase [Paenibacillus sp. MMS18-CY102]